MDSWRIHCYILDWSFFELLMRTITSTAIALSCQATIMRWQNMVCPADAHVTRVLKEQNGVEWGEFYRGVTVWVSGSNMCKFAPFV